MNIARFILIITCVFLFGLAGWKIGAAFDLWEPPGDTPIEFPDPDDQ